MTFNNLRLLATLILFSGLSLAQVPACTASRYRIVPIPISPSAINESGVIAGTSSTHKAASWTQETGIRELPVPAGFNAAEALALNSKGDLAGVATNASSGDRRAFISRGRRLLLLPGEQAKAWAINDAGVVAGEAVPKGKHVSAAVLWKKQTPTDLGGCCGGTVSTLNNEGEAGGQVYDEQGNYSAFRWDAGHGMERIGPAGMYSSAVTMNDKGHIVVQEYAKHSVYLYSNGKLNPIELSPKTPSRPRAMNNCDGIVGSYGPFADAERAFVWDATRGFRDLNDLIDPGSGWKLEAATGINDRGEIVGWGDYKHQEDRGFLLIPMP